MSSIDRMPDAYAKSTGSNLYNLLQLYREIFIDLENDMQSIAESRDLCSAYGATLDKYGEMLGQKRGGATDEQYRLEILNRIGRNVSSGDCDSVMHLISQMFGISPADISVQELGNATVLVAFGSLVYEDAGFTATEARDMVQSIMPVGVNVVLGFKGTFLYGAVEGETSTETGYDYGVLGSLL